MADEPRDSLRRLVYSRLRDAEFRASLTAETADGERPVLVALRSDKMSAIVEQASKIGGAANVTVPLWGGIVILAMTSELLHAGGDGSGVPGPQSIDDECTVGVFLQRALADAPEGEPISYAFRAPRTGGPTRTGQARAQFAGSTSP